MRLVSVYLSERAPKVLYDLLLERDPNVNISHKDMPTWEEHCAFVESRPYHAWYIMEENTVPVGAIYLTYQRELGLFVFKKHRGNGYGPQAMAELKRRHPGKLLANVSVRNRDGIAFWETQGFKPLQHTYIWEPHVES